MSKFDDLKAANLTYHIAVDEIFKESAPIPVDELAEVKAKFGAYHNNIFQLMAQAQTLLKPYYEGE